MKQNYGCKNKKKDLKVNVNIGPIKAWKIRKSIILDQTWVKEIFDDMNDIFRLLDENMVN